MTLILCYVGIVTLNVYEVMMCMTKNRLGKVYKRGNTYISDMVTARCVDCGMYIRRHYKDKHPLCIFCYQRIVYDH